MKDILNQIVTTRVGTFAVLLVAAFLEAYGDSCFQAGLHRSSGVARYVAFAGGVVTLSLYGLVVNTPPWEFGRLLGLYVVLFFIVAQIVAKVRFNQAPTAPILVGGSLILLGGMVLSFWQK
jgi:small multidrug resistance family-3 protein